MHINLINHIRKYVPLEDDDINSINDHFKHKTLKNKDYLLQSGQICKSFYFVDKGCLRMFFYNSKGIEQTVQFAIEDWWITDYFSLFDQTKSEYNIQATENSGILCIDYNDYNNLLREAPVLESYFRIMAQRALASSQWRLRLIFELSKEEMYLQFSSSFPQFVQRVPQYMLASYLGLTPEYLSEIRKRISQA